MYAERGTGLQRDLMGRVAEGCARKLNSVSIFSYGWLSK